MGGAKIGLYATRALQLICGAVVLGVGITLARDINTISHETGCYRNGDKNDQIKCSDLVGRYPSSTAYAAFTGAFGLLDALVGLGAAALVGAVPWFVTLGVDALAFLFYLAGGINSAVLRAHYHWDDHQGLNIWTRFDTITAFMFIGFLVTIAAMALVFVARGAIRKHSAV
ncbi:COP9 signalosome complex subunit 1 [Lecanosticta acicola]|uniref:COP9 signalosome complex subunit 1 n=1 Tax=Lecanosticta acicola TaxID=111012 RepID=A0AAI8W1B7_9PEZI|nr:COP9 signalosome complex subunit 1 [Lecanosticta acicola]